MLCNVLYQLNAVYLLQMRIYCPFSKSQGRVAAKSCGSAESGQTALAFVQPSSNKIAQELLECLAAGSESVKYKFVPPIQ